MNNKTTKDNTNEQSIDQKKWIVKIEYLEGMHKVDADACIKIPTELTAQLGWEVGDEVEWEETEIWEEDREHKGFTLANRSKRFREAAEALKQAISIDMEGE